MHQVPLQVNNVCLQDLTSLEQLLPPGTISLIYTLAYLVAIAAALSIIYGIAEWFSKDRVLKIIEGRRALVVVGDEAFYGKVAIPPRGGGGFEVYFPPENVENPLSLISFLMRSYGETGEEKFRREAEKLLREFKARGLVPQDFELNHVRHDPWQPPSLVSRKVYASELGNLKAIMLFRDFLEEKEVEKRRKELRRLFHPSPLRVLARKIYNALAFVKDKLASLTVKTTSTLATPLAPELKKGLAEMEKKAIGVVGATYDPFLENSIGRLLTVRVTDIDGEEKMYQGILREYSSNYLLLYDVSYRLQAITRFKGCSEEPGYPRLALRIHGFKFRLPSHLKVEKEKDGLVLENISNEVIKIESVKWEGGELKVGRVLRPGERVAIGAPPGGSFTVEYEVSKTVDIVWPRNKVKVVGLGEYPPKLLPEVISQKLPSF